MDLSNCSVGASVFDSIYNKKLVVSWVQKRQMYSKSSQLPKEKLKTMIMQNFVGTTKISFSNISEDVPWI